MSIDSHVSAVDAPYNAATRIHEHVETPRIGVDALQRLYRTARDRLEHEGGAPRVGYRLYWARDGEGEPQSCPLPASEDDYLVVGRHDRADVCLARDREISLRHLLVRVSHDEDGEPALRLLDLKATLPFHLHDAEAHRSIVATGPLALRLGRYALVAFPVRPDGTTDTGAENGDLPAPEVAEARDLPARHSWMVDGGSHVTSLPRASALVEMDDTMEEGDGRITVEREERRASVRVRAADLERGVLVGRADRCVDGGIRSVLSQEISRAHLLLLKDARGVRAYDLCSTNGTFERGTPVRSIPLDDGGVKLRLSGQGGVRLHWRRRPA